MTDDLIDESQLYIHVKKSLLCAHQAGWPLDV